MRLRQGITIAAILVSLLALTPGTASAEAAAPAQHSPTTALADELPFGWDEDGPYFVWGNMSCRIHLFKPEEWRDFWGTGRCWF